MDNDSFERSLREMLKQAPVSRDEDATLERVLKTANRQVGVSSVFTALGRAFYAVLLGLSKGSSHIQPVSRLTHTDKVE